MAFGASEGKTLRRTHAPVLKAQGVMGYNNKICGL